MVRHIGVGIHTHRLLGEVEQQAEENRRLYEDLRAIYRDTVRAFAAAIDIKDKYTQGHSERVGKYSEIIAREMGWGEEEVEGMANRRLSARHRQAGRRARHHQRALSIDAKQSSELNRHPGAGFRNPLAHSSSLRRHSADGEISSRASSTAAAIRMDLTDEQIPLGAKIVSLADSFDAMTTDRPYKTAAVV